MAKNFITEKELIGRIKELKSIKPQENWVVLAKSRIFGEETTKKNIFANPFPYFKPVFATAVIFFVLFGLFGYAENSVPGDFMYNIKKIAERGQILFVTEENMPEVSLQLANRRLEELNKILETNQVSKLAPAINEFQASVSEAAKNISRMEATSSNPIEVQKIVDKSKEIEERVEEIRALGVVIDSESLQGVSNKLEVKLLLSDLETRSLTDEQEEIVARMRELYEEEKYTEALLLLAEINAEEPVQPDEDSDLIDEDGEDISGDTEENDNDTENEENTEEGAEKDTEEKTENKEE